MNIQPQLTHLGVGPKQRGESERKVFRAFQYELDFEHRVKVDQILFEPLSIQHLRWILLSLRFSERMTRRHYPTAAPSRPWSSFSFWPLALKEIMSYGTRGEFSSICPTIHSSIRQSVHPSVHLSVHLSVHPSIRLF